MADPFRVKINGSVQDWTEDLKARIIDATQRNMLQAAVLAAGAIRQEVFSSFRPGTSKLARSYTATLLEPKNKKLRSGALSDLVYARIQDEGGEIVPNKAKALSIPVSTQARTLGRSGVGPRGFPTSLSLVWPRGRDRGFLIDGSGTVHYSLRKSVRIPGRGYLAEAKRAVEPDLVELFDAEIQKSADESKAGGE